jgi:ribosomal protein L37AE/L43A
MPIDLDDRGQALENEYFHRKEQELIAKMKEKLAAEDAQATQMDCPRCDGKLVETAYEDIKIDVCDKCSGVWFDAGELAQVLEKDDKGGSWFGRLFG